MVAIATVRWFDGCLAAFGEAAGGECPSALNKNVHARPECPFIEVTRTLIEPVPTAQSGRAIHYDGHSLPTKHSKPACGKLFKIAHFSRFNQRRSALSRSARHSTRRG
jgi:hypothetical protein